ncbi:MAG: ATP-binding cassette domain-containing protein [Bacteroidetes bacterium]|nr:ATP-binding cassette domain-containing protein [Bacteroidota bacterium]
MNVHTEHLRKQFTTVVAVDDVSLTITPGKIFGLIGPNGAGKSTTIRMLLNIIKPDSGTILYDGKPFSPEIRNAIGYLPEERGLYRKNGVLDTIMYFASLRGIESHQAKKLGMEWLGKFELSAYAKRKTEELSKGNQQKVQFIISILHNPSLIVLDEPFSGLDPVNQIVMKDIFQELKVQGKAVIFSTHQMESAEKLCDEICMINRGKIVLEGTLKTIKQKFGTNSLHIEYEGNGEFIKSLPFVKEATVYENYAEIILNGQIHSQEVLHALASKLDLRKFEYMEPSLNSIFLEIAGVPENGKENAQLEREKKNATPAPLLSQHPKVKRAMFSVLAAVLFSFFVVVTILKNNQADWTLIAVGAAVLGVSIFRYLKERKSAEKELRTTQGGSQ